jgi:hypothetical protein
MSNSIAVQEEEQPLIPDLLATLKPFVEHLQTLAATDERLRSHLRELGQTLVALTEPVQVVPPATLASNVEPTSTPAAINPVLPEIQEKSTNGAASLYPVNTREILRIVRPVTAAAVRSASITDADLELIAERCRLKAEGARWSATRQRLLRDGADYDTEIEPLDRDIIARAKALPDCFLWMCHRSGPTPEDLTQYDDLAGCFEAAADAVILIDQLLKSSEDEPEFFEEALDLAAEAQSSLRVAITDIGGNTDSDQYKIFQWLKTTGAERQILIRRYMRKDDPGVPALWQPLRERVQQLDEKIQATRDRDKRQRNLLSKMRYHLKLVEGNRGQARIYDWQKIIEAVDELINEGVPPSSREVRDLLLSVADEIPDSIDLPKNVKIVLRELEQYLTTRPVKEETAISPMLAEEVRRAAEFLRGRTLVLIGGLKRPLAADALTAALQIKELIWVEGRDQTYELFEPHVARNDVAAVILAIRWSRHGFGEVKAFCDKYEKPLVRLPGGYSPNQVAYHIVSQVGERLGAKIGIPYSLLTK